MNKKQKALLDKCVPYEPGTPLTSILIIPSGRLYKGPFYPNGYDHMILVGENTDNNKLYYINPNSETDVLAIFHVAHVYSIDIPHEYGGAVRVCFDTQVQIPDLSYSSIIPRSIKEDKEGENPAYDLGPSDGRFDEIYFPEGEPENVDANLSFDTTE